MIYIKLDNRGFTLIELLVTISIISLLSTIVIVSLRSTHSRGRDALRISQIKEVKNAIELYYSNHNEYPPSAHIAGPNTNGIPIRWASLIDRLHDDGLIINPFGFMNISIAYAVGAPGPGAYVYCSVQDPLYKVANDYLRSYGYLVSSDNQGYKIRIKLENLDSPLLQNSLSGKFLDNSTTGDTACDTSLGYYCIGGGNLDNFQPDL